MASTRASPSELSRPSIHSRLHFTSVPSLVLMPVTHVSTVFSLSSMTAATS
ncbi:MAG: hypothetical protein WC483_03800 [Candidatus Paceibacterota bacterium]